MTTGDSYTSQNDGVDDDTIGLTMVVRMNSVKIKLLPLIV